MNYHIWTFGCLQNKYDSSKLAHFLNSIGLSEAEAKDADLLIIIACSVRKSAVDRVFGRVKNLTKTHTDFSHRRGTDNPTMKQCSNETIILVTGCVIDGDKKKLKEKGVEFFEIGNFELLEKLISNHMKFNSKSKNSSRQKNNNETTAYGGVPQDAVTMKQSINEITYVPIMSGCDNFCSYCVVPYTRGRERSRPMEEIISEVQELIANGAKEIMLLGQNVNSYDNTINKSKVKSNKCNLKVKSDFVKLLEELNTLDRDFVISFMSNHPKDMADDLIDAVAKLPKIKKEIHLPLQSGSDRILKLMNRPYTAEEYLRQVKSLKSKVKSLKLSTDIIVGFPSESEEDFQATVKICQEAGFNLAYVNKYSPRPGTKSYELIDDVSWREKQRRWRILNDFINKS